MGLVREFRDFITSFSYPDNFTGLFGSAPSSAGVSVNEMAAMQSAAIAGCIRIISGTVAQLPINIYEVTGDDASLDREVAYDHTLQWLLNNAPNDETDAFMFKETLQIHLLLCGNAYVEIVRNKGGQIAALYIRNPFQTYPMRSQGNLVFYTTDGLNNGQQRLILPSSMVHIKGMSLDGLVGLNPIRTFAKETVGLDLGARMYGARLFAHDASPGGYLIAKNKLKEADRKKLEASWVQGHSGTNAHRFAVLDGGLEWKQVSLSPEQSQFLLTRGYQRDEIATIYGVPTHMLGDSRTEKASNMEQQQLQLLNSTIKPWLRRWESALEMKLLPTLGQSSGRYQIRFDTSEMERADFETTLKAIATGRQWGIYTANEGRRLLGKNPYKPKSSDPADQLWQPVNMMIAQDAEQGAEDQPQPQKLPDENNGQETKAIQAYSRTFKDAFQRYLKRDKRDFKSIQASFSPSLFGLCDLLQMNADPAFRAGDELPAGLASFVGDYMGAMHKRSAGWTDIDVAPEFERAVTALREAVEDEKGKTK